MSGYVRAALSAFKDALLDLDHSATYHDINIQKLSLAKKVFGSTGLTEMGKKLQLAGCLLYSVLRQATMNKVSLT